MKFYLLFLIGVSATALSAGRRDHKDHRPHGHEHSEGSYESFDSSRENFRLCESGFLGCVTPFFKYDKPSFNETLDLIRSTGAQEICREVLEAKGCAVDNLAEPVCHNIPSYEREYVKRMFNFIDYTCTDKFTDLEEHWDCVTDIDSLGQIDRCEGILRSWTLPCNDTVTAFKTCFIDGVNSRPNCKAGAGDYGLDLLNKANPYVFDCSRERPNMKAVKSLKLFWNRK